MAEEDDEARFSLVTSFWIDTDGYTERDREMFVAGVEFQMVYDQLTRGLLISRPVHRENESRLRMLCGQLGVRYHIQQHSGYEGCETWSDFKTYNTPTRKPDDG